MKNDKIFEHSPIHDLDLEQHKNSPVRRFYGDDGNVEVDQSFSFDSQSDTYRWIGNRKLAFAHYALRSLDKEKLKSLQGDVKDGIYNFE